MKKLVLSLCLCCIFIAMQAQTSASLNQEKLLEYYQNQRYMEARNYLDSVYGSRTEDPKAITQLAYASIMAGMLPQAESYYLKLNALQPTNIPVLFNLASINLRRGNDEKAKSYYKGILQLDSNNFKVYKQLAGLINSPANKEKLDYLTKAHALNPVEADLAYDLAIGLNTLEEYEKAYTVLVPAIKADSNNFVLLKARLSTCISLHKYEEALNLGQRIMASGDSSTYVVTSAGKIAYMQDAFEKAIGYFNYLERNEMQTETSLYFTALCYQKLKNYTLASDYIQRTITESLSPNMANYYMLSGSILEQRGLIKEASFAYKKGLEYESKASLYYNLAVLNDLKMNNKVAAVRYYNLYLKSKPDTIKQREALSYARSRISALK
jgi:tetratricopeptide (TPR) repeat protein